MKATFLALPILLSLSTVLSGEISAPKPGDHWSFQPVTRPAVPEVTSADWVKNPIDAFIMARLAEVDLRPSRTATREDLIRRLSFGLVGLPPSPEEIASYVADKSPKASEALADRLLSSPHFGERWARHWFDVVRFAQTNGYEYDAEKPESWRYRDWVIKAFNDDLPYDIFVRHQLAGDELPEPSNDSVIATTFYRLGPCDQEPDDKLDAEFEGLDGILSSVSNAFLGLTLQCARCHDHPTDPFPQRDYYTLLAHFRPIKIDPANMANLPSGEGAFVVTERIKEDLKTTIFAGGNPKAPGEEVAPGLPAVLLAGEDYEHRIEAREQTTGSRSALAAWITNRNNPLTARVIANRLWHYHFGRGLVATPNEFGKTGAPPTHPELLDWLAAELMDNGWSLKHLHRLIVTSATYQQTSRHHLLHGAAVDPENKLLWRQNSRRLDAESLRDAVLATSGSLNLTAGGRGFFPRLTPEELESEARTGEGWEFSSEEERRRRSIYIYAKRNLMPSLFEIFDCANPDLSTAARQSTIVAPQALTLLNGAFLSKGSRLFGERLYREAKGDRLQQIQRGFQLALGRQPLRKEVEIVSRYLARQQKAFREQPEMIRLRPAIPPTMVRDFRNAHQPEDYFIGPREDWSYFRGDAFVGMANLLTTIPDRGPFALWEGAQMAAGGTLTARTQFDAQTELASLIFCAQEKEELFHGYELRFSPRDHNASLIHHEKEVKTLGTVKVRAFDDWLSVKLSWNKDRIELFWNKDTKPALSVALPGPLPEESKIGLRTWGGELRVTDMTLAADGETYEIKGDPDERSPEEKALAGFANLLFNLNEFVYLE